MSYTTEALNMEHTILLTGMGKTEFKDLLKETLLEILKGEKDYYMRVASEIFNVREAAAFLKLKVATLYEKTSAKSIPHVKKGNKLYFHRSELEQWLKEGKVKTADEIQGEAINTMQKQKR